MSLIADDVAAAMPELVAEAESLMTLHATATRLDGTTVLDEATGAEVEGFTTVYEGRADLVRADNPVQVDAAGEQLAVLSSTLKLPRTAPRLRKGDDVLLSDGRRFVVVQDITHPRPVTARYAVEG